MNHTFHIIGVTYLVFLKKCSFKIGLNALVLTLEFLTYVILTNSTKKNCAYWKFTQILWGDLVYNVNICAYFIVITILRWARKFKKVQAKKNREIK